MKLFGKFEAVKLHEENMIFITHSGYRYYIYNLEYDRWRKHRNAGNDMGNVAEMRSVEISIEEDDVSQYLTPFLYKHYNDELEANKKRIEHQWTNDDGKRTGISCKRI
ncbi:MAG: hypothetical protein SOZ34_02340 [Clostridia bacterium]|nr:hypothetical protein [Clostridia bacterium]